MRIVFVSNFMNHHQLPISMELAKTKDVRYTFVATTPFNPDRKQVGYEDLNEKFDFIVRPYEGLTSKIHALRLCASCDVLIMGKAPWYYALWHVYTGKLTFFYSERPFKKKKYSWKRPFYALGYLLGTAFYKNSYLLSAGAYASSDFSSFLAFRGKAFKWGYFPEIRQYSDIRNLIKSKQPNSILWVGRFLSWKHPEAMIYLAEKLISDGIEFSMHMIGNGPLLESIQETIQKKNLRKYIHVLESLPNSEVRKYMETSQFFVFTSDRFEGWGAVLNEAMGSGCVAIAGNQIGAVPYLIQDGVNGVVFEDKNWEDLYLKVRNTLKDTVGSHSIAMQAYQFMRNLWSPECASKRLISLSRNLLVKSSYEQHDGPVARVS